VRDITHAAPGAKDWQPSAFSPQTGLLYVPHQHLAMDWESVEANYIAGTPYVGGEVRMKPGPGGHMGEFSAWDVQQGKEIWTIVFKLP
jgi:alcohol dehydrogenase (cytochrome c)